MAGGKQTTVAAFFGTAREGGLAKKENKANKSRGADASVTSLLSSLSSK